MRSTRDITGAEVASYQYDAWGKIVKATGEMAELNPLRYRGYYYDTETGLYYLKSRYYDPEICRFINADFYTSTESDFLGYNMFAYMILWCICFNDIRCSSGTQPVYNRNIKYILCLL